MTWLFLIAAVVGGTVLICQFVLTLVGLGGGHGDFVPDAGADFSAAADHDFSAAQLDNADTAGHDAAGHHGSSWMFAVISFRTLVAAAAFFGLIGLAAESAGQPRGVQLLLASLAGLGAMHGVHWLVRAMGRLGEDGTLKIHRALGQEGTVYVPIPPARSYAGKIQLRVENRLVEYEAITASERKLATGTKVRVVGIAGNVLEVAPAN
jgi:membrane protein implicated in regulation of membrane protease activity